MGQANTKYLELERKMEQAFMTKGAMLPTSSELSTLISYRDNAIERYYFVETPESKKAILDIFEDVNKKICSLVGL